MPDDRAELLALLDALVCEMERVADVLDGEQQPDQRLSRERVREYRERLEEFRRSEPGRGATASGC